MDDQKLWPGDLIVRGWNMYMVVDPSRGREGETYLGPRRSEFVPGSLETPEMWLSPAVVEEPPDGSVIAEPAVRP